MNRLTFSRYCAAKCALYFAVIFIDAEYSGDALKNSVAFAVFHHPDLSH